jgi:hypothetical protein
MRHEGKRIINCPYAEMKNIKAAQLPCTGRAIPLHSVAAGEL